MYRQELIIVVINSWYRIIGLFQKGTLFLNFLKSMTSTKIQLFETPLVLLQKFNLSCIASTRIKAYLLVVLQKFRFEYNLLYGTYCIHHAPYSSLLYSRKHVYLHLRICDKTLCMFY